LGVIANASGNYTQTQAYYEEVLAISQEIGDQRGVGLVFAGLALVYHQRGQQEMAQQYSQQAIAIAREVGSPFILGYALTYFGHALVALAQLNEAITAYQEAYTLRREAEQGDMSMDPLAGLARVAMLQGDKAGALAYAETIYAYLADHELSGAVEDRMRVYLTCYQVLAETADERSEALLETTYHMIQTVAQKQPEEVRPTYLAIPSHAAIVQAWHKRKRLS
jgi:tetratricopeptide (TPR) repeat protein